MDTDIYAALVASAIVNVPRCVPMTTASVCRSPTKATKGKAQQSHPPTANETHAALRQWLLTHLRTVLDGMQEDVESVLLKDRKERQEKKKAKEEGEEEISTSRSCVLTPELRQRLEHRLRALQCIDIASCADGILPALKGQREAEKKGLT